MGWYKLIHMKKTFTVLAAVVFFQTANAQSIDVSEQGVLFMSGQQNALVTTIYQNSKDDVVSKWKSYLKDFKNEKVKMDKEEMMGDNIVIKEWGNNPVDVYTRFEENKTDKSVKMMVAFDLGGAYLSSSGDAAKYSSAEKMIRDFAVKTTKEPYQEKLKDAQKTLSKLEDDQSGLEKDNKKLHSDIEDYKSKISKAESDIRSNESDQSKKKSELETQRTAIQLLNGQIEGVK
jgi:hypothetical protein